MAPERRGVAACRFVGRSLKDLQKFPGAVKDAVGYALFEAQCGFESKKAKPLKGFVGRGVLEIIEDYDGDTYRAVYTVRFADAVYVLHCFQKKSKTGIATPQKDVDLIRRRMRTVEAGGRTEGTAE